jgi:hypothetical protein
MADQNNKLYLYASPHHSLIQLVVDNGVSVIGIPTVHEGRQDAQLLEIPFDSTGIGCLVHISAEGFTSFEGRAILTTDEEDRSAFIHMDDFHLTPLATNPVPTPPTPTPNPPVNADDPEEIINWVHNNGDFDLSTHEGCGKFTEACCKQLHDLNSPQWGHFRKNPGQNQYNGHAVDAVQCLTGKHIGGWDIIHDSVSPSATPAFNYAGPPAPEAWYYPA